MYTRYYRLHYLFFGIGIAVMLLAFFGIAPLPFRILACISFLLATFFYYKVISVLEQVTDIKPLQVWVGILSYVAIMAAAYFVGSHAILSSLIIGAGVARLVAGIYAIDAQMGALCKELDEKCLQLAMQEQAAKASKK